MDDKKRKTTSDNDIDGQPDRKSTNGELSEETERVLRESFEELMEEQGEALHKLAKL